MKKSLKITFLILFFNNLFFINNAFSIETILTCNLTKYFIKKNFVNDERQVPLNEVSATYLEQEKLILDFDKRIFITSSIIFPNYFKSINFYEDRVSFEGLGAKKNEDIFHYTARLDRISGELKIITEPTNARARKKPEDGGFKLTRFYQCEKTKKKF